MALKYATKSGAWSNTTVWNDGTVPGNGDTVYTNNFTVSLDQDILIGGANNLDVNATALIVGCRYVIKATGTTIWTGIGASSNAVGTKFLCTAVGAGSGVATTDACITNRAQSPAVAGGAITVPGSRTIEASLMNNTTTLFAVTAGSITLVGDIHFSSSSCVTLAAGTSINMTGDIMRVAANSMGSGISATSAVVRITGNIYGSANTSSDNAGLYLFYPDAVVNGNVYGGPASTYSIGIISALSPAAGLTVNGNVYAGEGPGIRLSTSSPSLYVNGDVYAGQSSGVSGSGISVADNAAANVTVVGNVYGGEANGIYVGYSSSSTKKITVTGDVYGGNITSVSYGAEGINSPGAEVEVIGDVYAGSAGPAVYTKSKIMKFNGNEYDHANGTVAVVEVRDVLQPGLDSLRHEQGLLFGRFERGEELSQAFAVPVVGKCEADPAAGVAAIDGHTGRTEFGHGGGFAVLAALGGRGFEGR
jgi:hypothetical protein